MSSHSTNGRVRKYQFLCWPTHLKVNYSEIYSWFNNQMNFGWSKASQCPLRCFQNSLKMLAKYFKEFILKLKEACFAIVWIDGSSFRSASLPLYSWMPKGWDAERVIRPSSKRFNVIDTQWNKESYFVNKSDSTNEAPFINFVFELDKELRIRLDQNTYEKRMIVIYDNASIHKTKKVWVIMKKLKWVVFIIHPYSPELNQKEHTFSILKVRISKRNFNIKEFKKIIREKIIRLKLKIYKIK